jgi:hypothetical protein
VSPVTPPAMGMSQVLSQSAPLARLFALMRESNARFDAVRPHLPGALATHVKPGPLDENGWSLIVANAAVAAKLRHLVPRLEAALADAGWPATPIRLKVAGTSTG